MAGPDEPQDRTRLVQTQRASIPPFAALRAFEAVGSCGGIRRAAAALSIDHAAVSRHLRALEQWTGMTLIDRGSGAHGNLTEQGRAYHGRISAALAEIALATTDLMRREDDLRLRLWVAPGLASEWLSGRVGDFMREHPAVELELQPSDTPPAFGANEADAYLHYIIDAQREELSPTLRTVEIARPVILAVASPGLVAASPPVSTPADLLDRTLLHEASSDQWRRWFDQHGVADVGRLSGPKFWQGHLTLAAARQGQGIALANTLLVSDDLASGRLVPVGPFPDVFLGSYNFTTRRDNWRATAIAAFRRWLENAVARSDKR